MYFVKKGHVVMTWDEYHGVPVGIYDPGSTFGEFEVYKNTSRLFSCWAVTDLHLFVLHKKDFKKIFFQNFPSFGQKHLIMMDRAFEGLEGIMHMIIDFLVLENSHIFGATLEREKKFASSPKSDAPRKDYIRQYLKSFTRRPLIVRTAG